MNAELKSKWIAALRSGEFEQTTGILQARDGDNKLSFCCLGVLCKIAHPDMADVNTITVDKTSSPEVPIGYRKINMLVDGSDWGSAFMDTLIVMNDEERKNFSEIADFIEAKIPVDTVEAA